MILGHRSELTGVLLEPCENHSQRSYRPISACWSYPEVSGPEETACVPGYAVLGIVSTLAHLPQVPVECSGRGQGAMPYEGCGHQVVLPDCDFEVGGGRDRGDVTG